MIHWREGTVHEVRKLSSRAVLLIVSAGGQTRAAFAYPELTGVVDVGDRVVLNTSAVDLGLGTGGHDFVAYNLSRPPGTLPLPGHIVKLRYTPWQICCRTAESPEGQLHDELSGSDSVDGMPVVVLGLHSQLAPVVAALCELLPGIRIGYVMTDAGALPAAYSKTVAVLRNRDLLCLTVTCGHAFGGDLEAVNVFSGLQTAALSGCQIVVAGPGPGHVGTGTRFGFSGVEQGQIVDAVNVLGGWPVPVLRISFADSRERHRGVSHHSLTALGRVACTGALIGVPVLSPPDQDRVLGQLAAAAGMEKHTVKVVCGNVGNNVLDACSIDPMTMGRTRTDDPGFFLAAGAAGRVASELLEVTDSGPGGS